MDVFVSSNGDDALDGLSPGTAVRTITRGIALSSVDWAVHVEHGTYGVGELFPIEVNDRVLLGFDAAQRPVIRGADQILVRMSGSNSSIRNVDLETTINTTVNDRIALSVQATTAAVNDMSIQLHSSVTGIATDSVQPSNVTLTGVAIGCNKRPLTRGIATFGAATTLVRDCVITGCGVGLTVDGSAATTIRNTSFENAMTASVRVESGMSNGGALSLGTSSIPGGNVLQSDELTTHVGLDVLSPIQVQASGNLWRANIQDASDEGTYAVGYERAGPVVFLAGNNFALVSGATVQF